MSKIALVNGSYEAIFFVSPVTIAYRGRMYLLVETARHGLVLEAYAQANVDHGRENLLTPFLTPTDTQPQ